MIMKLLKNAGGEGEGEVSSAGGRWWSPDGGSGDKALKNIALLTSGGQINS